MMSKLKDFFFSFIYALYMLDKCKATVSYMVMTWAVNTVACHINYKVNNKLVSGLADQRTQVFCTFLLFCFVFFLSQADAGALQANV